VLLDKNAQAIPSIFEGYSRFELDAFRLENSESQYSKLYRLLTGQRSRLMNDVGALQKLPPLPEEERRTDFVRLTEQVLAEIRGVRSDTNEILVIVRELARGFGTSASEYAGKIQDFLESMIGFSSLESLLVLDVDSGSPYANGQIVSRRY
jgi:hypothetical protein